MYIFCLKSLIALISELNKGGGGGYGQMLNIIDCDLKSEILL